MLRKRLTGFCALMMTVMLMISLLTGCGGAATMTYGDGGADAPTLTVYMLDASERFYNIGILAALEKHAEQVSLNKGVNVEVVSFLNRNDLKKRLEKEIAAGKGPDVVISSSELTLDVMELARSGALYDMAEVIAADEEFTDENYYTGVMQAGVIDAQQYVIPLSFSMPILASTPWRLEMLGLDFEGKSAPEIYAQLIECLEREEEPQVGNQLNVSSETFLTLAAAAGDPLVPNDSGEAGEGSERLRDYIDLTLQLTIHTTRWRSANYSLGSVDRSVYGQMPIFFADANASPNYLRQVYQYFKSAGRGEDFTLFPLITDDGHTCVQVKDFAAVMAGCENPELAWELLRGVIDRAQHMGNYDACVFNRMNMESCLKGISGPGGGSQLPQRVTDTLTAAYADIGDAVIYQSIPEIDACEDAVDDYFADKISYDELVDIVSRAMKVRRAG